MDTSNYKDLLTNTLNRSGLFLTYEEKEFNDNIQILFFDLDNFKTINDMYGHHMGDSALAIFAEILCKHAPGGSLVSRLGGDEYVVIIPNHLNRDEIDNIVNNILHDTRCLKEQNHIYEVLSCSAGVLCNYDPSGKLDDALNLADKALYYSKENGRDTYTFYDDIKAQILHNKEIESNAVQALRDDKFTIMYHPTIHLHSSELLCSEACCVWQMDDGNYLHRNDFRPVLEKNGFIKEIDIRIFEQACADMSKFRKAGRNTDIIAVQLSYLHILDNNIADRLEDIMNKYGVKASDFEINVDEKSFGMRTSIDKIIANMNLLHSRGFSLALTKFGEDFSSMRFLRDLPIVALKFDGEFVSENLNSKSGIRILKSAAALGRELKLIAIASNLDDKDSLIKLVKAGFDAATGDYFCKKLPFDDYLDFVNNHLNIDDTTVSYPFKENLWDISNTYNAEMVGENLELTEGISPKWGAVKFPGGLVETNYIKLPTELFEYSSYTVSMWLYPFEVQNWISAFYIRYIDGFTSFMPNVDGGRCIYRIHEDENLDTWYDVLANAIRTDKWSFIAFSYDSFTQLSRLYINGELAATIPDVPDLQIPTEVWLGGDNFQVSYHGLISAVQINKGSLTGDDIRERYQSFINEIS